MPSGIWSSWGCADMARVLAVTNQKGGVGKTTTVVNLAASLAERGQRVLLVDLDPQGNATKGSGVDKGQLRHSVYHVLVDGLDPAAVRCRGEGVAFDVLPANRDLAAAEVELVDAVQRESRLRTALAPIAGEYDCILIDCPPALNLLTLNGLVAATGAIIPMQCEYYALEGLSDLVTTLRKLRVALNPAIDIVGLVRTMYDARSTLAQQVSAELAQHFPGKLFETVIPRNIRLAEAPSYGLPVLAYDRRAKGTKAYLALADELLARLDAMAVTA